MPGWTGLTRVGKDTTPINESDEKSEDLKDPPTETEEDITDLDTSDDEGEQYHLNSPAKIFFYEDVLKGDKDEGFHVDTGALCDDLYRGQTVFYKETREEIIFHVVDLDIFEYHKVVLHSYMNTVLQSGWFRWSILFLVILSAIMIGLTTFPQFKKYQDVFKMIDQIVLSIFVFEIAVKWIYDFRLFWTTIWNFLDFMIVAIIIVMAIFPISKNGTGSRAIVIVRVVRAFRSLKSVSSLSSLTVLSKAVVQSGKEMMNILLVLIVFMLVMSVVGVILFDSPDVSETKWFLNALNSWFLLFICVTCDGWNSLLEEFRDVVHGVDYYILVLFLFIAVAVGGFIFSNLIVAVIAANLESAVNDQIDERMREDDLLNTKIETFSDYVEILAIYEALVQENGALRRQRPLKLPQPLNVSLRRLETYIHLIIALEQNMVEAELISMDLEKVMAVMLSLMLQLDLYSAPETEREKEEGVEVLADLLRLGAIERDRPEDAIDRIEKAAFVQKMKKRQSVN